MRRLLLLRHAKSDWPFGVSDIERPLNERGRAVAPRMGAYLVSEGLLPDYVMVSPARRTQETWERLGASLPGLNVETVPSLYEASPTRILDAIRTTPDAANSLLVIGHNPGLESAASDLVGPVDRDQRTAMHTKFPTAALAVLDFDVESWEAVGGAGGRLERFVTPRSLERAA